MPIQMEHYKMVNKGAHSYGEIAHLFAEGDPATVGKFCSIAGGVQIFSGGNHRTDWISTYPFGQRGIGKGKEEAARSAGPVIIGNDVWIGSNVIFMSGSSVGHGCVVGAYSVVRGSFPPYSVIIGNPAYIQRMRFPEEDIKKLLEIAWWDWPIEQIKEVSDILQSNDLKALYEYAERRKV